MSNEDHRYDELEDKGTVFGRYSDEDYDGIIEGNGKIPWWLILIIAVTIFEAFLFTMPWPGFGQRYDSVTTTFISHSGAQPFWDWGYYLIMIQIVVVLSGIAAVIWTINVKMWKKEEQLRQQQEALQESESNSSEADQQQ